MKWLQGWRDKIPEQKYAIHAALLGDSSRLPWSNLGLWQHSSSNYVSACTALAEHLAKSVHLNSNDKLLDLGCGQGASLAHWLSQYELPYVAGVELQKRCVEQIQQQLPDLNAIYHASFLKLKQIHFSQRFDVVLCIDAAYHSPIHDLVEQMQSVLNSKGRIGFHYLALTDRFESLNSFQKAKYRMLLKAADVNLNNLMSVGALYQAVDEFEFKDIQVEDLSEFVLAGFADYVDFHLNLKQQLLETDATQLDVFKVQMIAKLCRRLFDEGVVRYVQVTAQAKY